MTQKKVNPKNTGKFKYTVNEVKKLIDDYFADTKEDEQTVTGLALCFGSKQLMNDYQARPKYKKIITEAKLMIENEYEKSLRKHGRSGDIFALKNFGWTDKQEFEHSGKDGKAIKIKVTDEL